MVNLAPTPDISAVRNSLIQIKDTPAQKGFRVLNVIVLTSFTALVLYPFINLIAKAFSSEGYIAAGEVNLWPKGFNTETFRVVMSDPMFWRNYGNTVIYTIVGTAIAMVLTTMYAYAISRRQLKGKGFFTGLAVFTMFFSGGMIPTYILVAQVLGMRNTMWAIVIPGAISVFNMLVMKSFFENFPVELEEAAELDGLNTYGILLRIVLPLSKAVLATMTLFYAVGLWNSWFSAFLYLDQKELFPVTMYLRNLIAAATGTQEISGGQGDTVQIAANIQSVTMLLTVLPIMALYPFIQKYFVSGVMLGSVKG